jgi:glutamate racemase
LKVDAVACPLFVSLAEEGWTEGPIAEAVARRYLEIELAGPARTRVDTLVLGCTHFPVLRGVIERVCGPGVKLVDSARTTAEAVAKALHAQGLLAGLQAGAGAVRFLATDAPERFARVGGVFLGAQIQVADVELVDL